jgi:UbiD family decarboxylase
MVKCETNDLLVPAYSEIVLEGEIIAGVRVDEGPFGEFTGYRTPRSRQILYKINAITHRNDPILTMSCMGMPVDDASIIRSIDTAVQIKRLLNQYKIPYTDVCVPPHTGQHLAIVGIKKMYNYNIAQIQDLICVYGRIPTTIVVDDDVDVFDMNAVMHAFVTKCHPAHGIKVREGERVIPLTPYLSLEEGRTTTGPKVLFDCTWPLEWSKETRVPPRMTFNEAYPEAVKQKVLQNWSRYGF